MAMLRLTNYFYLIVILSCALWAVEGSWARQNLTGNIDSQRELNLLKRPADSGPNAPEEQSFMTEQSSMTLPERINLQTIGLRRSNRLRDLQERTAKKMKKEVEWKRAPQIWDNP